MEISDNLRWIIEHCVEHILLFTILFTFEIFIGHIENRLSCCLSHNNLWTKSRLSLVISHEQRLFLQIGGDMVYLLYHHRENSLFNEIVFVIRIIQDVVFIIVVCFYKIRYYEPLICIQHKALFSVISRLEVILAILVPIFSQEKLVQRTVANISLFILYDFFSEYYALFTLRLKSALWLFVVFISISVVHEWLYFVNREWRLCDNMSIGFELLAEMACCLVIVWQFELPYNSPDSPIISPV